MKKIDAGHIVPLHFHYKRVSILNNIFITKRDILFIRFIFSQRSIHTGAGLPTRDGFFANRYSVYPGSGRIPNNRGTRHYESLH
jgi:hypothetical protein